MNEDLLFDLLNRALEEEMGLVIETNNPNYLVNKLSAVKRDLDRYATLIIAVPSTPNTVILVKKSVELNEDPWANAGDLPDVV